MLKKGADTPLLCMTGTKNDECGHKNLFMVLHDGRENGEYAGLTGVRQDDLEWSGASISTLRIPLAPRRLSSIFQLSNLDGLSSRKDNARPMPKSVLNTIVFVGREFKTSMFDERALEQVFGLLEGEQIKAGPIGQFNYARGQFWITPDRVDLRCHEQREILPEKIIEAARKVAGEIESMRKAISISAVGINCDTVFYSQEIHQEGREFCHALTDTGLSHQFLPEQEKSKVAVTFTFLSDAVQYNIRLEPENGSRGRDLFVAINGHQNVASGDPLDGKLEAISRVKTQIERCHHQVLHSSGD